MAKPTRRRAVLIAVGALLLTTAVVGCGGSNSSSPSGYAVTVLDTGALSNAIPLSTVSVSSSGGDVTSSQELTALGFQ